MTGEEFVAQVVKLQTDHGLTDGELCSACAGILITLCRGRMGTILRPSFTGRCRRRITWNRPQGDTST